MRNNKPLLIIALLLPLALIIGKMTFQEVSIRQGQKVKLKITGYDPRDLLAGHYITFRVDYQNTASCKSAKLPYSKPHYVCLQKDSKGIATATKFTSKIDDSCPLFIKGKCKYSSFNIGLTKYFVPEHKAKTLEDIIRKKQALIEVSVTKSGNAYITDLLVDDKPWKEHKDTKQKTEDPKNFEF